MPKCHHCNLESDSSLCRRSTRTRTHLTQAGWRDRPHENSIPPTLCRTQWANRLSRAHEADQRHLRSLRDAQCLFTPA